MVANTGRKTTSLAASALVLALTSAASMTPASAFKRRVPADPNRLFVIERSVNANVVAYDAVRRGDGRLDTADPVAAYWLMYADKGQRQALNVVEKLEAYGFDVAKGPRGGVTITLKAVKDRPIEVKANGARVVALTRIAGREAVLRRVFVQSEKGHPLEVKYVELFGEALHGGKAVRERIKPG